MRIHESNIPVPLCESHARALHRVRPSAPITKYAPSMHKKCGVAFCSQPARYFVLKNLEEL